MNNIPTKESLLIQKFDEVRYTIIVLPYDELIGYLIFENNEWDYSPFELDGYISFDKHEVIGVKLKELNNK